MKAFALCNSAICYCIKYDICTGGYYHYVSVCSLQFCNTLLHQIRHLHWWSLPQWKRLLSAILQYVTKSNTTSALGVITTMKAFALCNSAICYCIKYDICTWGHYHYVNVSSLQFCNMLLHQIRHLYWWSLPLWKRLLSAILQYVTASNTTSALGVITPMKGSALCNSVICYCIKYDIYTGCHYRSSTSAFTRNRAVINHHDHRHVYVKENRTSKLMKTF